MNSRTTVFDYGKEFLLFLIFTTQIKFLVSNSSLVINCLQQNKSVNSETGVFDYIKEFLFFFLNFTTQIKFLVSNNSLILLQFHYYFDRIFETIGVIASN